MLAEPGCECQTALVTAATVTISWLMWSGGLCNGLSVDETPHGERCGLQSLVLGPASVLTAAGGRGGDQGRVGIGWGRIEGQEWGPGVEHSLKTIWFAF